MHDFVGLRIIITTKQDLARQVDGQQHITSLSPSQEEVEDEVSSIQHALSLVSEVDGWYIDDRRYNTQMYLS